jgi:hypothetical protein
MGCSHRLEHCLGNGAAFLGAVLQLGDNRLAGDDQLGDSIKLAAQQCCGLGSAQPFQLVGTFLLFSEKADEPERQGFDVLPGLWLRN